MSGLPKATRSRIPNVFRMVGQPLKESQGRTLRRCRFPSLLPPQDKLPRWHLRTVVATTALLALIVGLVAVPGSAKAAPAPASSAGPALPVAVHPQSDPTISITANYDTIGAGLEDLVFTLTRTGSTEESLSVVVLLAQDEEWLSDLSHGVAFRVGDATAELTLSYGLFSSDVTTSGDLTATVQAVDGYDVSRAAFTVRVVSQEGIAMRISLDQSSYRVTEAPGGPC